MGNRPKYFPPVKNNITVISAFILSILFLIISVALVNNGLSVLWLIPPFLVLAFLAFSAIDKFLFLSSSGSLFLKQLPTFLFLLN
jgi:hypothetical protein